VTETVVKAQGSLWWETEAMEVQSGSHRGQTILPSARSTLTKVPTVATQLSPALQPDTSLSLATTEHTLHRTIEKTFDIKN